MSNRKSDTMLWKFQVTVALVAGLLIMTRLQFYYSIKYGSSNVPHSIYCLFYFVSNINLIIFAVVNKSLSVVLELICFFFFSVFIRSYWFIISIFTVSFLISFLFPIFDFNAHSCCTASLSIIWNSTRLCLTFKTNWCLSASSRRCN